MSDNVRVSLVYKGLGTRYSNNSNLELSIRSNYSVSKLFKPTTNERSTSMKHKLFLVEKICRTMSNRNFKEFEGYEATRDEVKHLVYKDKNVNSNKDFVKCCFMFYGIEISKSSRVYLLKSKEALKCTRKTRKISDMAKAMGITKRKKKNQVQENIDMSTYFSCEYIGNFKPVMEINIQTNNPKVNIYHIAILEENNMVHIGDPFTLITFRQFTRRQEKSFINDLFENYKRNEKYENILMYYLKGLYDFENDDLKEVLNFGIGFYTDKSKTIIEKDLPFTSYLPEQAVSYTYPPSPNSETSLLENYSPLSSTNGDMNILSLPPSPISEESFTDISSDMSLMSFNGGQDSLLQTPTLGIGNKNLLESPTFEIENINLLQSLQNQYLIQQITQNQNLLSTGMDLSLSLLGNQSQNVLLPLGLENLNFLPINQSKIELPPSPGKEDTNLSQNVLSPALGLGNLNLITLNQNQVVLPPSPGKEDLNLISFDQQQSILPLSFGENSDSLNQNQVVLPPSPGKEDLNLMSFEQQQSILPLSFGENSDSLNENFNKLISNLSDLSDQYTNLEPLMEPLGSKSDTSLLPYTGRELINAMSISTLDETTKLDSLLSQSNNEVNGLSNVISCSNVNQLESSIEIENNPFCLYTNI